MTPPYWRIGKRIQTEVLKNELAKLAALRAEDRFTPDLVFHDPYILDFLGLKDRYLEMDLEVAIEVSRARLAAKDGGAE